MPNNDPIGGNTGANQGANPGANNDRLSWGDTVFLHLEREGMPLNVASVCVFEGEIPFNACVRFVEGKLPLIPRYLKRVVPPPLDIGLPNWEYDPTFDIRNHVREVTLKQGSDAELKVLAEKILSTVMDREHPLWDLTLVHGLKGGRCGLIFRLHHCLADGIAGVGIMNVLMDTTAVTRRLPRRKLKVPVSPPRGILTSLTESFVDSYSDIVKQVVDGFADVSSLAERFATNGGDGTARQFSHLLPELGASTERLCFNVLYRGPQKFACAEIPLDQIKAIRHACGTSVNDVVLALVTATMRRYVELHGDKVEGRLFRMMVPVNLRGNESPGELGNRISLVPVTVPLDIRDPGKLLAAIHERMEFLKRSRAAELVSLAGGLIGMLPPTARALAGHVISRLPFTPFNMVCTNVPGPQHPLYLLGRKMLHCYPYVPVGGEMALNCAILTYNGTAYFGFSGDVHAAPDLQLLENFLKLSFAELRLAAGIATSAQTTRTTAQAKPAKTRTKGDKQEKKAESVPPKANTVPTLKRTRASEQIHEYSSVPAPMAASLPSEPGESVESAIASAPPVHEERVLTYATGR